MTRRDGLLGLSGVAASAGYTSLDWTLVALTGLGGFVAAYFVVKALFFSVAVPARAGRGVGVRWRPRRGVGRGLRVREPDDVDAAPFAGQQPGMGAQRVAT